MTRPSRFFSLLTLFFGAMLVQPFTALAALSANEAVNKASLQGMLSQQMVKNYCQVGQEAEVTEGTRELKAAVDLFEKQMGELKELANDPESSAAYAKMGDAWTSMKPLATQPISRDKAEQLYTSGDKVLEAADKFTQLLVVRTKSEGAKLVNLSGRQRMLAHRIGASYLMLSWGFADERYRAGYDAGAAEFEDNMTHLSTDPNSSPQVLETLKQVSKKWTLYKNSAQIDSGKYYAGMVVKLLDKIYTMMDEATQNYAAAR